VLDCFPHQQTEDDDDGEIRVFSVSCSWSSIVLDCFTHRQTGDDDEHEDDEEIQRLSHNRHRRRRARLLSYQQTEADDDHENDQENSRPFPLSSSWSSSSSV